jgi:signal transduction histidine kinase
MIKQDPVKNKLLINSCMETIQQAIDENRKIAHALVAPDFETKILSEQIADLTDNMLKTSGIDVDINTTYLVESLLEEDQKLAIYRIAQEQCANIIKYAKAQLVDISLSTSDECFKMIIADDGMGMETNKPTKGIGLKNIKGRLSIFNGTVTIKSAPCKGFTLEITMPLKKANISDLRSPKTKNIVSIKKDTL